MLSDIRSPAKSRLDRVNTSIKSNRVLSAHTDSCTLHLLSIGVEWSNQLHRDSIVIDIVLQLGSCIYSLTIGKCFEVSLIFLNIRTWRTNRKLKLLQIRNFFHKHRPTYGRSRGGGMGVKQLFVKIIRELMNGAIHHHSVNSSSHSVNGDIAIQWEWSNFDHS